LPPSYAKKDYSSLNDEEKGVVDSFQGEFEYTKVYNDPDKYLFNSSKQFLLTA